MTKNCTAAHETLQATLIMEEPYLRNRGSKTLVAVFLKDDTEGCYRD